VNNFAKIILVQRFNKVNFYTIKIEGDELSLFGQFKVKHTHENIKKLNHILAWIKIIGNNYGAINKLFRNESETADTSGLPPKNPNLEPRYIDLEDVTQSGKINNLRLYTFRANEHVVFLFNGDIKTTDKAQKCPNVKPHFRLANKLTKLIDEGFRNGDITWNQNMTDIKFTKDLELNW
jgi:hypothetical protein